ncbi:RagB/SusD domain protein, partial [Elysia marginata]
MLTTEKPVQRNKVTIDVVLLQDTSALEEVVLVGYGTQKRVDITGAVSTLKVKDLQEVPTAHTDEILQGQIAGVQITNTNGSPNANVSINIRGLNSIGGSGEPLIIRDGIQGVSLKDISPRDIASIEVLKDASATAVYGSRGANGVILITTKKGGNTVPSISYDSYFSFTQVRKKLDMMSPYEQAGYIINYKKVKGEPSIFTDEDIERYREGGTDWQDKIFRDGFSQNHHLTLNGGSEDVRYNISGDYLSTRGVVEGSSYERYFLAPYFSANIGKRLKLELNLYGSSILDMPVQQYARDREGSPIYAAQLFSPTKPVKESDGSYSQPKGAHFDFASCTGITLEESPPGLLIPGNSKLSKTEMQGLLSGVFQALYSEWKGFDCPYPIVMTAGGEDVKASAEVYKNFDQLSATAEESLISTLWKSLYKSITNANGLLKEITSNNIEKNVQEEDVDQAEGQARFIRALAYFFLVRWFGEVQLITPENQSKFKTVKQSEISDIYKYIVNDLKIAEGKLPTSFQERGRPNQYAAKALLAKVYLTMAGWPLEDTSNYALARDKAKEVMDSGVYKLEANFEDLWSHSKRLTNKEFIFAFYGSVDSQGIAGSHLHIASASPSSDGWGDFFSERRFVESFPPGDARKSASITDEDGGKFYTKKYLDAGNTVGNNGEGVTVLLRYADVLLIYAEAENAHSGPSPSAYAAVNKVRKRAKLADLSNKLSQEDFDKAILNERKWELAFEMNRWFDL